MERRTLWLGAILGGFLTAGLGAEGRQGDAKAATGPFALPTLDVVKDKCKTRDDQNKKLEVIYKNAAGKEAETRKNAQEQGIDRKQLENFLSMGKIDTVGKIKDVLDGAQAKTFDALTAASDPGRKKK